MTEKIEKLVQLYLEGSLSAKDGTALMSWLKETPENELAFRKLCDAYIPQTSSKTEESWERLMQKRQLRQASKNLLGSSIKKTENGPGRKKQYSHSSFRLKVSLVLRYAAILALGMILAFSAHTFLTRYEPGNSGKQWISAETGLGQKTKLVLPDSSTVWLNSDSRISFSCDFEKHRERIVRLEGEAFFDVTDQGRNRFIVQCADYSVEVKGTKFNVMAYRDFKRTETTLVEGSVIVHKGKQQLQLRPGERAMASGAYLTRSKAKVRQATLWKENKFYFDNVAFTELARRLERWYNVKITLADRSLDDIYYSGYFKNEETVWQVLDVISLTTPITYERKDFREITIYEKTN